MTSEQIRQALLNTIQKPRNHAPLIREAIEKTKPAASGMASGLILNDSGIHYGTNPKE